MPARFHTPYHLGPQSAEALLRPIDAALAELESRLAHYVERIPMSEADRDRVARAHELVARCRSGLGDLAARPSDRA
ncbi:MAG: hypothetical protein IRY83_00695 [Chloroflexi bacterium]|nr:hypothetical protein [Chloroflexota bacterium]